MVSKHGIEVAARKRERVLCSIILLLLCLVYLNAPLYRKEGAFAPGSSTML